ncbi:MAG: hypothetical protein Q7J54_05855 [Candidatus Woesearchaeota archaeon]|nr:hypothetical protein [Candidatus Woesearchaeota archaeon]
MNKKMLLIMPLLLLALISLAFALGPSITIVSPVNNTILPNSTTSVDLRIYTNESALECRYNTTTANFSYENSSTRILETLLNLSVHNLTWNVASGNTYNFYYKCNSSSGINDVGVHHTFSVNATANITDATATIRGYAFLEGQTDHSGITVDLGINGAGPTGNYGTTATNGSYTLYNVTPAAANYYFTWAHKTTYSDGGVNLPEIVAGQTYTLGDLWLNSNKNISFEWAYQPVNASKNLTSGLQTGSVTLFSAIDDKKGFIFNTSTITNPVADIYFSDSNDNPMSFWANNGNGGVIDMGAVLLNSVTTAPDAGYNSQNTSVVIGHTYVVKTRDGFHYAKLYTYIDTTPPAISNVGNSTPPTNNVTIIWNTNENSNSTVYYGLTTAYGSKAKNDTNLTVNHSVLLTGLATGNVLYHYAVESCDTAGNCANSSDYNFTTVGVAAGSVGGSINCTWPATGNWTINGTMYVKCENENITFGGEIIIRDKATLFLNKSELTLNGSFTLNNIDLYNGANFTIIGSKIHATELSIIDLFSSSSIYIENSIINKTGLDVLDNANATLKNATFIRLGAQPVRFYFNARGRIENSFFGKTEFFGNSANEIIDSIFNDTAEFFDYSNNTIINSTFNLEARFYNYSNNTIKNATFKDYARFLGNTTNKINRTTFYSTTSFDGNSNNRINESTIFYSETSFNGSSINSIDDSIMGGNVIINGESNNTFMNTTINATASISEKSNNKINGGHIDYLVIYSDSTNNLTIDGLKTGIATNDIRSTTTNFAINLSNVDIAYLGFGARGNSTNYLTNSRINVTLLEGNSTNRLRNFEAHHLGDSSLYLADSSDNTIEDSNISSVFIQPYYGILTINGLQPGLINNYINSTERFKINFSNTNVSEIKFSSHLNSVNYIQNSTFSYIILRGNSTINFDAPLSTTNEFDVYTKDSTVTIRGHINITAKDITDFHDRTNITRVFPIYVYDQHGSPVNNKKIEIRDENDSVIYEGNTNEGYINITLVFNYSNYYKNYSIYVEAPPTQKIGEFGLLNSTPIEVQIALPAQPTTSNTDDNSGGSPPIVIPCKPNWQCTDWVPCSKEGTRSRSCMNLNSCTGTKPATTESCTYAELAPAKEETKKEETKEEVVNLFEKAKMPDNLNNEVNRITAAAVSGSIAEANAPIDQIINTTNLIATLSTIVAGLGVYMFYQLKSLVFINL